MIIAAIETLHDAAEYTGFLFMLILLILFLDDDI
jgi:hypothetical protein